MFKREPTIPLAFYEAQVQLWSMERAELLNKIQHPTVFTPAERQLDPMAGQALPPVQPVSAYSEAEERELALVGSVILGPDEGGGPASAPKE